MKTWIALVSLISLMVLSGCSIAPAQPEHLKVSYTDLAENKLSEGSAPPDFQLPDGQGNDISLSEVLAQNHVMLIFYRGEWCPYCIDQLDSLQALLPELVKYKMRLVAISPDKSSAVLNTQRRFGQDYLFLSDSELVATGAYGLASDKELPHPAVFLLEQAPSPASSRIMWMYASTDHKTRPTGQQLKQKVADLFTK